jgi:hypothetical protein
MLAERKLEMDDSLIPRLGRASKIFDQCSGAAKAKAGPGGLTVSEYERVVGLGIACDWLKWAHSLHSLKYSNTRQSGSNRAYGLQELTRFTFMWTAANALFSRPAIIDLLDQTMGANATELESFRVLFRHSSLSVTEATGFESVLHKLLASEMHVDHFPWGLRSSPITTLDVIFHKYTVAKQQKTSIGNKLSQAITTGSYSNLDLSTLIYATRNWNIHGVHISSSFRGPHKKFNVWIDTVNFALARVLEGSAKELKSAI